jgi:hypothetical protein
MNEEVVVASFEKYILLPSRKDSEAHTNIAL